MHGVPTPLLTMSLEDHVSKKMEAQRTRTSADARFRFHDRAVGSLKSAGVENIASLAIEAITELADLAEEVWGT